jgi:small ligand-binding sensory domain FIST
MQSAAALSTHPIASHATGDVIADILDLGRTSPDLAIVFATSAFSGASEDILRAIDVLLTPTKLLFVSSSGVIGAGSEVDGKAALSLWSFWSETTEPDVAFVGLDEGLAGVDYLSTRQLATAQTVVVLADPSVPMVTQTIESLCELRTNKVISGGLLSGSNGAPSIRDSTGRNFGCVAIAFQSTIAEAMIAHGSAPIAGPMTVTSSTGAMVCELDGSPALDVAYEVLQHAELEDRNSAAQNLALAVLDPETVTIIDVHEVLGADRESGALAVAASLPEGTTVAFHRKDSSDPTSSLNEAFVGGRSLGALIFTCSLIDPKADTEGVSDLGPLTESLGTASYAGVHVSTVIGTGSNGPGLSAAPLSAVIFGRRHY